MALIRNRQPVQTVPKLRPRAAVHNLDTWRISKNTTHMFQYCSAKVPLRFSASKAPLHRHPLAFAHAQNALSYLPVSKNIPSSLSAPKASLVFARTQIALLSLPAPKAPSCPPESKTALRGCLNPRLPFTITCTQSPSCHPGSKDPPRVRPSLKHPSCSPKS